MAKLVFFVGPAAAGKTTLAKRLAGKRGTAVFDMDTLLRPAAEAIMKQLGLDPNDRDSAEYKAHCRDLGYRITMDAALENVELGVDAIVIGPFTKETQNAAWLPKELSKLDSDAASAVEVKVVTVYLPEEEDYRQRIQQRGSVLDLWKLEHWAHFRQSLAPRDIHWKLPASSKLAFDNSGPLTVEKLEALEHFIYGAGSSHSI
jgi:predicted kinase